MYYKNSEKRRTTNDKRRTTNDDLDQIDLSNRCVIRPFKKCTILNVLIYFEKSDQEAVINRLVSHLRPGGYLLLGHSESMIGTSVTMRQVAPAVFQKAGA